MITDPGDRAAASTPDRPVGRPGLDAAERAESAGERARELELRRRRLSDGQLVTEDDVSRAEAAAQVERERSLHAHVRAAVAHTRAAETHRQASVLLDAAGHHEEAAEHRRAALRDEAAATADEGSAHPTSDEPLPNRPA